MYEIRTEKNRLRKKYKELRDSLTQDEKAKLDERICNRFMSLVSYRFADTLLLYAPIGGEIDITAIALSALKAGKRVAYPRCIPENSEMFFHYVTSLGELTPGSYGIPEPSADAPLFKKEDAGSRESCICLIPALIYDRRGYRIGYGKGYYDRYLSGFRGTKAGIIYNNCIADTLPHGRFDLRVNFTVSERGVNMINED